MICYRAAAFHTPLWNEPNVTDGRFHRTGQGPVQYLCEHPLGPLAEALRRLPPGLDPAHMRRPVWAVRLPDAPIESLGFDQAPDWGLAPYDLVSPPAGYASCQVVGETLLARLDPPPMLRVPSAALPGTWNVVVFGPRVLAPWSPDPLDPGLDVPAAPVAIDARALDELIPLVRPLDEAKHAAFDAWADGKPYAFVEPSTLGLDG